MVAPLRMPIGNPVEEADYQNFVGQQMGCMAMLLSCLGMTVPEVVQILRCLATSMMVIHPELSLSLMA
tara:strand:- start:1 stop:204 length:204 start_codon:yes stop_codon:yes gene_type:complete